MIWIALTLAYPLAPRAEDHARDPIARAHRFYFEGELGKAAELYRAAVRQDPSSSDSCLDLSIVLQDLGRNKEAIEMLEACLKSAPSDPRLRSAAAWAHYHEGELAKAAEAFSTSDGADSSLALDALGAAQVLLERKSPGQALEILGKLASTRPRLALVYYYQAKAFEAQGRWDEAVGAYEKVLKEDSHFVEVRPFLAAIHESRRRFDDAWKQYSKIIIVDSKNAKARKGKVKSEPLLTKEPAEILPIKTLARHTAVEPAPDWKKNFMVSVGIGASAGGNVSPRKTVSFRAAGPFSATDSQTGKELAKGGAGDTWVVRVNPHDPGAGELIDPQGKAAGTFRKSVRLRQEDQAHRTFIIDRIPYAGGYAWGGTADRELRGGIEIALEPAQKSLVVINHVNVEEYLYGVLNSEMPTRWPLEALKAQAVLARTQAAYLRKIQRPHRAHGYDLCDEQHCQVYGGVAAETQRAKFAVNDTREQILTYNGAPAHTVFFSNCGGQTQSGKEIGWADVAYWQSVFDGKDPAQAPDSLWRLKEWLKTEPAVYCNLPKYISNSEFRWTRLVQAEDLEARVLRIKDIGRIRALVPMRRSRSGHLNGLKIQGTSGDLVLNKEHEIRRVLGLGPLRSTLFVIETTYRKGRPRFFTIFGGGWGHGVGMCQAGAGGRAEEGAKFQEILSRYYAGTKLDRVAEAEKISR